MCDAEEWIPPYLEEDNNKASTSFLTALPTDILKNLLPYLSVGVEDDKAVASGTMLSLYRTGKHFKKSLEEIFRYNETSFLTMFGKINFTYVTLYRRFTDAPGLSAINDVIYPRALMERYTCTYVGHITNNNKMTSFPSDELRCQALSLIKGGNCAYHSYRCDDCGRYDGQITVVSPACNNSAMIFKEALKIRVKGFGNLCPILDDVDLIKAMCCCWKRVCRDGCVFKCNACDVQSRTVSANIEYTPQLCHYKYCYCEKSVLNVMPYLPNETDINDSMLKLLATHPGGARLVKQSGKVARRDAKKFVDNCLLPEYFRSSCHTRTLCAKCITTPSNISKEIFTPAIMWRNHKEHKSIKVSDHCECNNQDRFSPCVHDQPFYWPCNEETEQAILRQTKYRTSAVSGNKTAKTAMRTVKLPFQLCTVCINKDCVNPNGKTKLSYDVWFRVIADKVPFRTGLLCDLCKKCGTVLDADYRSEEHYAKQREKERVNALNLNKHLFLDVHGLVRHNMGAKLMTDFLTTNQVLRRTAIKWLRGGEESSSDDSEEE